MAVFDMKKLSTLDKVVVGASGIALISLFLPWYGFSGGIYSDSVSGFSTGLFGLLGALLIIGAGVYLSMTRAGSNVPKMSMGPGVVVFGASLIGTVLVLLRWLTVPRANFGAGYSYGPRIGMLLTLFVGIIQAICAFMLFKSSGEDVPWSQKQAPKPSDGPTT